MADPVPARAPVAVVWSHKAIAGAVFGILGLATLWLGIGLLFAAIAAVLGHLARHDTSEGDLRGRRLAGLDLFMGYGAMLLFPVLLMVMALAFPALNLWRSDEVARQEAESRTRIERLHSACESYARANRDRYPAKWEDLKGAFLPGGELTRLLQSPYPGGRDVAFELVRHDRPVLPAISDTQIVIQEIAPPGIARIAVVYANGTVANLHNPDHISP